MTINNNRTFANFVESAKKVYDSCFPCTAWSRKSNHLTCLDFKGYVIKRILFAIIAFWILAAIFGGLLLSLFAIAAAAGLLVNPMLTIGIVLGILALILLAPGVFLLLRGALYHLLARFFGGKGSYAQTVDVLVKSSAAHLVLMIPLYLAFATLIGFVLSPLSYAVIFYSIYLTYRGLMHAHALPQKNAIITVVAGYVIEFGIGAVIVIIMQAARVLMLLGRGG